MTARLALALILAASAYAEISHHVVQLRPQGETLMVMETFIWTAGKPGSLRVYIPDAVAKSAQSGEYKLEKTSRPNVYEIKVPALDKDTPIQVAYQTPFSGEFSSRSLQPDAPTRFLVPRGVKLSGESIEEKEAPAGMSGVVYAAQAAAYKIKVEGQAEAEPAAKSESDGPSIERILPRIYDRLYPILGIAFAILLAGFLLLYRRTAK